MKGYFPENMLELQVELQKAERESTGIHNWETALNSVGDSF